MPEIYVSTDVETDWSILAGGLYVIHNEIDHKFYVGSTRNFDKRFILHRHLLRRGRHHSPHLQAAWDKYGEAAFRFNRIQAIADKAARLAIEQHFMDTLHPEYNVSRVATSCAGVVRSAATREKMVAAMRDPARIAAIRALGKRPKSDEHKAKIAASHMGIRPSEETRAKLRAASAARWARPEEREKSRRAKAERDAIAKAKKLQADAGRPGAL